MDVDLHDAEPSLNLVASQDLLELVQREEAVLARVRGVEEVQQLVGVGLPLLHLLPHCVLGVVCRDGQCVLQEEGRDNAEHGEGHRNDVEEEENAVEPIHLFHEEPSVIRPTAAEGQLEQCVEGSGGGAVHEIYPLQRLLLQPGFLERGAQGLNHEQRCHQHDDSQQRDGPEQRDEAGEHGVDQDLQIVEDPHCLQNAQGPQQPHETERPQDVQVHLRAVVVAPGEVQVQRRRHHQENVEQVRLLQAVLPKEPCPEHREAHNDLDGEVDVEDMLSVQEDRVRVEDLPVEQPERDSALVARVLELHADEDHIHDDPQRGEAVKGPFDKVLDPL
mmetsp:Transcript_56163/g.162760  ORF Transcript_56163/g.162760 Transcript_56163/m.162760 type:complete len:332 (-) Transcript_56163:314-1309(-)